jgi:hypothetical protein
MIHGMGFGALYLLGASGATVGLWRNGSPVSGNSRRDSFLSGYLIVMATLAWLTVLTGTYVVYPWYRAVPPRGIANLNGYPQRFLLASSSTAGWHSFGMEWKEHVAWLVPISITMAAVVFIRYGGRLREHGSLRSGVLWFVGVSFLAAGIAGFFGAMLNKNAPVSGGPTIQITQGHQP